MSKLIMRDQAHTQWPQEPVWVEEAPKETPLRHIVAVLFVVFLLGLFVTCF